VAPSAELSPEGEAERRALACWEPIWRPGPGRAARARRCRCGFSREHERNEPLSADLCPSSGVARVIGQPISADGGAPRSLSRSR
jgi:hypothetical protein